MNFSMTGQEKGDLLIQVTSWAGLTVPLFVIRVTWIILLIIMFIKTCKKSFAGLIYHRILFIFGRILVLSIVKLFRPFGLLACSQKLINYSAFKSLD